MRWLVTAAIYVISVAALVCVAATGDTVEAPRDHWWLNTPVEAEAGQLRGRLRGQRSVSDLTCDDTSATSTSAGLQTFLDGITTGGSSQSDPRVVCLTASTITLTSQINWSVPDNIVLIGTGSLTQHGGGSTMTTFVDQYNGGVQNPVMQLSSIDAYFRFAGFKYQATSSATANRNAGMMTFSGNTTQFRLDHFTFDALDSSDQGKWMYFGGCLYGVIDHAQFDLPNDLAWLHFVNGGCTDFMGNSKWPEATGFGGASFMFLEDSVWNADGDPTVSDTTVSDCHTSGKFVIRFSSVTAATIGQTHATIHGSDDRGCRAHEIYANSHTLHTAGDDPAYALAANNSGPAMVWGNAISGSVERMLQFSNCRNPSPSNCGYPLTPPPDGWGACASAWDSGTDACIDGPGRGQTQDSISGVFPNKINDRTGGTDWPVQTLEGVYEWENTGTPTQNFVTNLSPVVIQENREFYLHNGNTSCNPGAGSCTAGVGVGTRAQRPANCTTGVAWWATDQGSWNTSASNPNGAQKNGADGVLDKCTATNTWTDAFYTPYTYPHPLNQ